MEAVPLTLPVALSILAVLEPNCIYIRGCVRSRQYSGMPCLEARWKDYESLSSIIKQRKLTARFFSLAARGKPLRSARSRSILFAGSMSSVP